MAVKPQLLVSVWYFRKLDQFISRMTSTTYPVIGAGLINSDVSQPH